MGKKKEAELESQCKKCMKAAEKLITVAPAKVDYLGMDSKMAIQFGVFEFWWQRFHGKSRKDAWEMARWIRARAELGEWTQDSYEVYLRKIDQYGWKAKERQKS